jgi:hypothetical protein
MGLGVEQDLDVQQGVDGGHAGAGEGPADGSGRPLEEAALGVALLEAPGGLLEVVCRAMDERLEGVAVLQGPASTPDAIQ